MEEIALLDDRFEVLKTLGQRKLLVRDREREDETPLILRTLDPEDDPFDVELRREVHQTVAVQHPAIARIHAIDTLADGREYYTQDFVEGEGLYQWAMTRPALEILDVFAQFLHILAAYHSRGLVIGGQRPLQLKVQPGPRLRLVDQGGLLREFTRSRGMGFHGLAPERRVGARVDRRANLYEAGLILYELLAGSGSHEVGSLREHHSGSTPPPLTQLAPGLPLDLATFVMVLLRRFPDDRPPDVSQALVTLEGLSGQKLAEGELPAVRLPLPPPLVGRSTELERVLGWCQAVKPPETARWSARPAAALPDEPPSFVVITGNAGSGRRRLLDEVALRLGTEDVLLERGRCGGGGQGPFGPFGEILRRLLQRPRLSRAMHAGPSHTKWVLRTLFPDLAADLPAGTSPLELEDEAAISLRRLDALTQHFLEVASVQPLAILLSHFDLARAPTRALALHLARRAHAAQGDHGKLLLLVSWEGDPDDELTGDVFRTLRLDPLTSQDTEFLATAILGEEGCTPDLRQFLDAHAQGNPALALSFVGQHVAGTLQAEPPGSEPTRLVDRHAEQVLALEAGPRRAVLAMALLKRRTPLSVLGRLSGVQVSELVPDFERLTDEQVLERYAEEEFSLRDPELSRRLAGKLNQEASELLERLPQALADELPEGDWAASLEQVLEVAELAAVGRAAEPLQQHGPLAASYLESLGDHRRAANLLAALRRVSDEDDLALREREIRDRLKGDDPRRAEELLRELIDERGELPAPEAARLWEQLTESLILQDKDGEARSALSWAMTYVSDQDEDYGLERARLAARAAELHLSAEELEDAAAQISAGVDALKGAPKDPIARRLHARLLGLDGQLAIVQDDPERATQLFKAALAIQDKAELRADSALTQQRLGQAAFAAGQLSVAESHWSSALMRFTALSDLPGTARIHSSLGLLAARRGALPRAHEHLEKSLELRRVFGDRRGTAASLHNLAYVYGCAGALDEAAAAYRESLELRLAEGDRYYAAAASNNLGEVLLQLGRTAEAHALLLDAYEARHELGDRRGEAASLSNLAEVDLRQGEFGRALQRLAHAQRIRDELGDPDDALDGLRRRGSCLLSLGRLDEARTAIEEALGVVEEGGMQLLEGPLRLLLGQVQARRGRRGNARRELERARRAADQVGDNVTARSAAIELAALRLAGGRPGEARAQLDSRPVPRPGRMKQAALKGRSPVDRRGVLRVRERLLRARIELGLEGGSVSTAARCAEEALTEARRAGIVDLEWRALQAMAAAAEVRHNHEQALSLTVETQERVEQLLAGVPEEHQEAFLQADPVRQAALAGDSPVKVLGVKARAPGTEPRPLADPGTDSLLHAMVESTVPTIQPAKSGGSASDEVAAGLPLDVGFQTLLRLNRLVVDEPDLARVQETIVRSAVELCRAERGFLATFGDTHDDVLVLASQGIDDVEGARQRFFRHCAFKAASSGQLVMSADARVAPETKTQAHVVGLGLRSVLAAPVIAPGGQRGALYVDHAFQVGRFTDREVELIEALSDQCAMSIGRGALEAALHHKQGISPGVPQRQFLEAHAELERPTPVELGDTTRGLVGRSKSLREALTTIEKVGPTEVAVLIEGPGGVGKGMAARAIHEASGRKKMIVCDVRDLPSEHIEVELFGHAAGAFPGAKRDRTGLLLSANRGTLLLEHVDEAPPEVQAKLVRSLEEGSVLPLGGEERVPFDVRLVATVQPDPETRVREGRLREDLFLLLGRARVALTPLDERPEDKGPLIDAFIRSWKRAGNSPMQVSPEARAVLETRRYPGNARELNAVLATAASMVDDRPIEADDLIPERTTDPAPLGDAVKEFERRYVESAFLACRGDMTATANLLGISRRALKRKIDQFKIAP